MSQKWRRSQEWDRQHFPSWAWPARAILHVFSTITLSVFLLGFVVVYAIVASVPVGLLATVPTYLVYGLTALLAIALVGAVLVWLPGRLLKRSGAGGGIRFAAGLVGVLASIVLGSLAWNRFVWPSLHYDPATGHGLMLFADFVARYSSTTLRRLPGVEMSELEFYSWWPLRVVLLAFVLNMVIATVRRIEFTFENIGVLTVHTGIVMIALGSVYYTGLKKEGDTILFAGQASPSGEPTIGPPSSSFYDNTRVALFVDQFKGYEQRPLRGVPRYNEYGLDAGHPDAPTLSRIAGRATESDAAAARTLSMSVMDRPTQLVDPDISFRIVGYAPYAEVEEDLRKATDAEIAAARSAGTALRSVRTVNMHSFLPDEKGRTPEGPVWVFPLEPSRPSARVAGDQVVAIEYMLNADETRWRDLGERIPLGARNALVVEVPASGFREVYAVERGSRLEVGDTGYTLTVADITPEPPFPIITKGYEGATSSVAIVRVTEPGGGSFERWIYHRFPEISQDMLDTVNERGMPARRDADPGIRISYIDANQVNVYIDERPDGGVRSIVRLPSGEVRAAESADPTSHIDIVPGRIAVSVGERWEHAIPVARPRPTPEHERDSQFMGTHDRAVLGVEVSASLGPTAAAERWSTVVWLPFCKYLEIADDLVKRVDLPDGRSLNLAFGRVRHPLPGFDVRLVDFQMIAYDHRGAPRDYQSTLLVSPNGRGPAFEAFTHVTRLNAPLTAPFRWNPERSWFTNAAGRLAAGLNPSQYKFSQAGWDAEMWKQTQAMVDAGQLKRPFVRYTILGVGNNPGIHIIAFGSVMMAVGIPWAFYVKPLLVQRKKRKIQRQLAEGTYVRPTPRTEELAAAAIGKGSIS